MGLMFGTNSEMRICYTGKGKVITRTGGVNVTAGKKKETGS